MQSKTAAAHITRVRAGQGAGNKVPSMYGGNTQALLRTCRAQNTINSILARNQARRHWVYSGNYPGTFVHPKNARNAETKCQSGAVRIPLLALSALQLAPTPASEFHRNQTPHLSYLRHQFNHSATSAVPFTAYHVIFKCPVTRITRKSSSCFIHGIAVTN